MTQETAIRLTPAKTVTIPLAAACLGLTEKAIRRKIDDGIWLIGREFHKAPDGRIYINLPGVERWVATAGVSTRQPRSSASTSPSADAESPAS